MIYKILNLALPLLFFMKPMPIKAQAMISNDVAVELNKLIDGPLTKYISIAMAFLLVTIVAAFIFQIIRLSFNPDHPFIRMDIMRNLASLSAMLVAIGFFSSVGFSWIINIMDKRRDTIVPGVIQSGDVSDSLWNNILLDYKELVIVFFVFASVTLVLGMIIQFMKLGVTSGNPQARTKALMGIIWTGIAAAMLGGLSLILNLLLSTGIV